MLSLTSLSRNIYALVRLADTNGINIKYVHKGNVYLMNIERTYEKYNYNQDRRIRKKRADIKKGIIMVTEDCEKCGSVVMNKICINKNCESNKPAKLAT